MPIQTQRVIFKIIFREAPYKGSYKRSLINFAYTYKNYITNDANNKKPSKLKIFQEIMKKSFEKDYFDNSDMIIPESEKLTTCDFGDYFEF